MQLIINADDFGLTKATNYAVLELANLSTISSTTVMVNMPYAIEASKLLAINHFGIGLHFNLTQGRPISDPKLVPSLVNKAGSFFNVKVFRDKIKNKEIKQADILTELTAQFSLLEEIIGSKISHIDSHQDINKYRLINKVLLEFAKQKKNHFGLRWYNKMYLNFSEDAAQIIEPSLLNLSKFGFKRFVTEKYFQSKRKKLKRSFKLSDGMLYSGNHNMRTLLTQLALLPSELLTDKVLELMVHPAISTDELSDTKMLDARIEEYEILKSPEFQEFIQKNKLLSFADLK